MNNEHLYEPKIHLAKEFDSTDHACNCRVTFNTKYVTNFFYKVTCLHCLKIVDSMKRSGKLNLTETMRLTDERNSRQQIKPLT